LKPTMAMTRRRTNMQALQNARLVYGRRRGPDL
jgi:hypothetical protein